MAYCSSVELPFRNRHLVFGKGCARGTREVKSRLIRPRIFAYDADAYVQFPSPQRLTSVLLRLGRTRREVEMLLCYLYRYHPQ